jgi:hypothetical protein
MSKAMTRTNAEIREIAAGIVFTVVANTLSKYPAVRKAVDKIDKEQWRETVDQLAESVEEIILNKFGCSD